MNLQQLKFRAAAYGSEPFWFGLGFIQLKLSDRDRMHFWTPSIPRKQREEIHNHRYEFKSIVLAGKLKFQTFTASTNSMGAYEVFETNCTQEGTTLTKLIKPVDIRSTGYYEINTGSKYTFPHHHFHTTEETVFAITYLRRGEKVREFADVIKTRGAGTDCPFAEKICPEQCWEYIGAALTHARRQAPHSIPCVNCGAPTGAFSQTEPNVEQHHCGYC